MRIDELADSCGTPRTRRLVAGYRIALLAEGRQLCPRCRRWLHALFAHVSSRACEADLAAYHRQRESELCSGGLGFAVIVQDSGEAVGIATYRHIRLARGSLLYVGTGFVATGHQNNGLGTQIVGALVRDRLRRCLRWPFYVSMATPNPVVYETCRRAAGARNFHPAVDGPVPAPVQDLAAEIVRHIGYGDALDRRTLRIAAAYAVPTLFEAPPRSRDPDVNAFFGRLLRPHDVVLTIARVTPGNLSAGLARVAVKRLRKAIALPGGPR
jgi:hypothetical protein